MAIIVSCRRYLNCPFTYSSLSYQFLESQQLFWGSVTWHYGIIGVLTRHIVGFLMPRSILAWNGVPWRLYVLESTGLAMGFLCLWGIGVLIFRRLSQARIRVVTSPMDLVVLLALLVQVVAGVWTAIFYRWGSPWYATSAVPYLRSLFLFHPDLSTVRTLPIMVKVHIVGSFGLVLILPFTRLVHFLSVPLQYVWRPPQVVVWNQRSIAASLDK